MGGPRGSGGRVAGVADVKEVVPEITATCNPARLLPQRYKAADRRVPSRAADGHRILQEGEGCESCRVLQQYMNNLQRLWTQWKVASVAPGRAPGVQPRFKRLPHCMLSENGVLAGDQRSTMSTIKGRVARLGLLAPATRVCPRCRTSTGCHTQMWAVQIAYMSLFDHLTPGASATRRRSATL